MLPIQPGTYMTFGTQFFGDFLRIIHIRNTGVAFSIGANWNDGVRRALFSIVPIPFVRTTFCSIMFLFKH